MVRNLIIFGWFFFCSVFVFYTSASEKIVLAHYMPWYSAKPEVGEWGWHWTMDHSDPNDVRWNGKRKIASHQYPLIGLYDSGDISGDISGDFVIYNDVSNKRFESKSISVCNRGNFIGSASSDGP